MLSQDDQARFREIERQLAQEDPRFARALGEGRPRRPAGDTCWWAVTVLALAALAIVTAVLAMSFSLLLFGTVLIGAAMLLRRRHIHRGQRLSPRRGQSPGAAAAS
ncbi:DUF3040 domain-containing protein [Allokutzneria sp. A3M-2-11 16]|uniref:DUF3040 domain-containing protein n=1 Tax=Allokutzneria sp. A3M-2-11 16 TaxID=2962043 RepID=UPI0020B75B30|nr:DUF3040 domain-containing protein [Allokutzneria sp. A3M-2-11 16]MCP3801471.1 DUF3040 domain-containing protein [Allokutzneria sp. A3M-2-11 16]